MALDDIVKIEHLFVGTNNTECVNVQHYAQIGDAFTDFDAASLASFAGDVANVQTALLAIASSYIVGVSVVATVLTGLAAGIQIIDTTNAGVAGTTTASDGPIERCIVFSLRTALIGRANRGRLYSVAPGKDVFNDEGTLLPGNSDATRINTAVIRILAVRAGPLTNCMVPCLFHPAAALKGQVILQAEPSPVCGTQRRRKEA